MRAHSVMLIMRSYDNAYTNRAMGQGSRRRRGRTGRTPSVTAAITYTVGQRHEVMP